MRKSPDEMDWILRSQRWCLWAAVAVLVISVVELVVVIFIRVHP